MPVDWLKTLKSVLCQEFYDRRVDLIWTFEIPNMPARADLDIIAVRYGFGYFSAQMRGT